MIKVIDIQNGIRVFFFYFDLVIFKNLHRKLWKEWHWFNKPKSGMLKITPMADYRINPNIFYVEYRLKSLKGQKLRK